MTLFSFRRDGELLAVGALKQLDAGHAELKSMHTAAHARGAGIGRAVLAHLIGVARDRGCSRVSLETGSMPAFGPARALYASAGFSPVRAVRRLPAEPDQQFHDAAAGAEARAQRLVRRLTAARLRLRRLRAPSARITSPATATTGRPAAQKLLPDIPPPPMTPKPCRAKTIPAIVSTAPTATSSPFINIPFPSGS